VLTGIFWRRQDNELQGPAPFWAPLMMPAFGVVESAAHLCFRLHRLRDLYGLILARMSHHQHLQPLFCVHNTVLFIFILIWPEAREMKQNYVLTYDEQTMNNTNKKDLHSRAAMGTRRMELEANSVDSIHLYRNQSVSRQL